MTKRRFTVGAAREILQDLRSQESDKFFGKNLVWERLWEAAQQSPLFGEAQAMYHAALKALETVRTLNEAYNLGIDNGYFSLAPEEYVVQVVLTDAQRRQIRSQADKDVMRIRDEIRERFRRFHLRLELAETPTEVRQVLTDAGYKFDEEGGEASHADGTTADS